MSKVGRFLARVQPLEPPNLTPLLRHSVAPRREVGPLSLHPHHPGPTSRPSSPLFIRLLGAAGDRVAFLRSSVTSSLPPAARIGNECGW